MSKTTSFLIFGKRKFIFWLIAICCFILVIYLISLFDFLNIFLQELLTNGLLFSVVILPCLLALLPFAVISSICFIWMGKGIIRTLLWFILCLVTFAIMIMANIIPKLPVMAFGFLFLAFPISLIGTFLIFDSKDMFRKVYSIILLIPILLCAPTVLCHTLPYLYSPPVLTRKSLKVYNEALLFLLERNQLTTFRMNMRDWIPRDVRKVMTEDDLEQARKIRLKLINIACYQLEKKDAVVLFYKHGNRIFPPGPGTVYSLSGINPNNIVNEQINELKPFENLIGNWYISRNMTFAGPRIDILIKTPKALIDRSTVIRNVSAEQLHLFDNR